MHAYSLATHEGVALMCLAEALLRVPDAETAGRADPRQDRRRRLAAPARRVRAASCQRLDLGADADRPGAGRGPAGRASPARCAPGRAALGEPVIREAVRQAMRDAGPAVRARPDHRARRSSARAGREEQGYPLLLRHAGRGGAHRGRRRALLRAYRDAIAAHRRRRCTPARVRDNPGISVKLSALHPRYEFAQRERVHGRAAAAARSRSRAGRARADMGFNIDAEESRPARALARRHRAPCSPTRAGRLGRLRRRRAGLWQARRAT